MKLSSLWEEIKFKNHEELLNIQKKHELPDFVVSSLLDSSEISHLRTHKDCFYLVLNFPANKIPYNPNRDQLHALTIIIDKNKLTFIHRANSTLTSFFSNVNASTTIELLYEFLSYVFETFEKEINLIRKELEEIEEKVIHTPENQEIKRLFSIQKIVIRFQTALTGLIETLLSIHTDKNNLLWDKKYEDFYNDIRIELNQLDKTVNMLNDILKSLLETTASIQSNNLSKRMKTLTSLTIVISIPTLITGFYGMNIDLPFQDHPYSLLIVSVVSFVITLISTIYLYKKDLF